MYFVWSGVFVTFWPFKPVSGDRILCVLCEFEFVFNFGFLSQSVGIGFYVFCVKFLLLFGLLSHIKWLKGDRPVPSSSHYI